MTTKNLRTGAECVRPQAPRPAKRGKRPFGASGRKPCFNSGERTGSSFDDFLEEEGIYERCKAIAIKRVLTRQLEEEMKRKNLTKTEMAKQMQTSRAQLDERWSVPTLLRNGESANADCSIPKKQE